LLFNANSAILSVISWREQVNLQLDDDDVRFVLDQQAYLDFYSASSLKQQSADRHVTPTRTHYPDSEPTSLCYFSYTCSPYNKIFIYSIFAFSSHFT
jgi:hypothetical protein